MLVFVSFFHSSSYCTSSPTSVSTNRYFLRTFNFSSHKLSGRQYLLHVSGSFVFLGVFLFNLYNLRDLLSDIPKHIVIHEAGEGVLYFVSLPTVTNFISAFVSLFSFRYFIRLCFGNREEGLPTTHNE